MESPREGLANRTGLAPGQSVGKCVLVRLERSVGDTQIWLARTTTFPQEPMTVRARAQDVMDRASPFASEILLGQNLTHASLVVARESIEIGPWSCAVTRGAPGIPLPELHEVLASLRTTNEGEWTEIVTHIVRSLLAALDAAHRTTTPDHPKGIVHGGLRPELVEIAPDGAVRLGGFAATVDDDPSRIVDRSGDVVAYVAPEQLGSRTRAPTMDLWSLGAVLHELVDGRRFRGHIDDPRELYRIALTGVIAPLQQTAPAALEQLRASLLAKNVRERPRSATDALASTVKPSALAITRLGELVRARPPDDAPRIEAPAPITPPAMPPDLSQIVPPFVPPPIPVEEGTVAIDPFDLAAMRSASGSGRTPLAEAPPPPSIGEEDAPVVRRRPGRANFDTPTPAAPTPAPPRAAATPPPTLHIPPPPPLDPSPAPPPGAAPPPRAPPTIARDRIDFEPPAEGTSFTIREVRRTKRSFAVILAVAAVLAIVVGVVAGVVIADDGGGDSKAPTPDPAKRDAPSKAAPERSPEGPVLQPRAP